MTRAIRLPIAPATATTCGLGVTREDTCQFVRVSRVEFCSLYNSDRMLKRAKDGLRRWPECIAAEVET